MVVATLAWPIRSHTTFGLTPCSKSIVAWVCCNLWIVSFRSPAVPTTLLNALVTTLGSNRKPTD